MPFDFLMLFGGGYNGIWNMVAPEDRESLCQRFGFEWTHILLGALGCLLHRVIRNLINAPATAYQIFFIDKPYGLAETGIPEFLWMRFAMLLEFTILNIPVLIFAYKIFAWSGDYVITSFFLLTSIVVLGIIWVYPRLI